MKQILYKLFEHQYLGRDEARTILQNIAQGKYNDVQVASLITVFLMRNISVEELCGFRDALLEMRVLFYKEPQYYSHVIHLVSRVSGQLNEGADKIKTFIDTFPAGTLSGAPKVRAMQLISEIEPHNRGAYGGCIGFIGLNGELNQAITIRTFVSRNNELWFQAGGGIVARSQDEYELQEVNNKLGALKKAIDLAVNLKN